MDVIRCKNFNKTTNKLYLYIAGQFMTKSYLSNPDGVFVTI